MHNTTHKDKIKLLKSQCEAYLLLDRALGGDSCYKIQATECLKVAKQVYKDYLEDQTIELNFKYLEVA